VCGGAIFAAIEQQGCQASAVRFVDCRFAAYGDAQVKHDNRWFGQYSAAEGALEPRAPLNLRFPWT